MSPKTASIRLILVISLLCLGVLPQQVQAQEGGEKQTFDDPGLEGWEHSEGTSVISGTLQIQPENFALLFRDLPASSYQFDFKKTDPGVLVFRYAISDRGEYALILHDEAITLELAQEGSLQFLGENPWRPGDSEWQTIMIQLGPESHQISLDETVIITTEESEPLIGSGLGFWVEGEGPVEIDNLTLGQPPGGQEEDHGEDPTTQEQASGVGETQEEEVSSPAATGITLESLLAEFTTAQATPTQLSTFVINLGLAVVLAYILSRVYIHWGSSLSNRRRFAANFILITVTTTFIILVVRSSVALSLGLVGALSIVRFRSAIKEPEELAYLFFAIAIGIGLGDNQRLITVIALAAAILVLGILRLFRGRQADFNLHLTVTSPEARMDFEALLSILKKNCAQMKLIRFDESTSSQESSFLVEFRDLEQFKQAKNALRELDDSLDITFLDNKGIW